MSDGWAGAGLAWLRFRGRYMADLVGLGRCGVKGEKNDDKNRTVGLFDQMSERGRPG